MDKLRKHLAERVLALPDCGIDHGAMCRTYTLTILREIRGKVDKIRTPYMEPDERKAAWFEGVIAAQKEIDAAIAKIEGGGK